MIRSDIGNSLAASMMGLRLLSNEAKAYDIMTLHNMAGSADALNGQFSNAFEHFYASLLLSERIGDNEMISTVLTNLGWLHYKMYDNETACEVWEEALAYDSASEYEYVCRINIALASLNLGRHEKARVILNNLKGVVDNMDRVYKSNYYYTVGTLFDSLDQVDSARYFFLRSLAVSKDYDRRFEAENMLSLSRLMIKEGKYDSASMILARADQLAREQSYVDIRSIYQRQGTENKKIQELQSSFGVLISVIGVAAMLTVVLLIYSYSIQKRNERSLSGIVKMRVKYLDSRTKAVEKLLEEKAIVVQKWDFKSRKVFR